MSIGEKITELRKEKELTQTELAEKLQIGQSTVSEWERGRKENIDSLFGLKIYDRNEKPTNSEFIALIADKIVLDD